MSEEHFESGVRRVDAIRRQVPGLGQIVQSLGGVAVIQLCLVGSGILTARKLGPAGRGDVAVMLALPAVVMQLVGIGFPSALTYFVARQRVLWMAIVRRIVWPAMLQMAIGLIILVGLDWYFLGARQQGAFAAGIVVALSFPIMIFLYYAVHLVQGLGDIRWFNVLRVSNAATYSGGIVVASVLGLTVFRCALVWTASQLLVALAAAVDLVRRRRRWRLEHREHELVGESPSSHAMARFAVSGFLGQISPIESFRIDTLVVAALFPARVVGFYSVANSITNVPLFSADALSAVAYPRVAVADGEAALRGARRYMRLAWLLCGGGAIASALLIPVILPFLFGAAYEPAVTTAELLAFAAALLGLRRIGNDLLRALGRPGLSTRLEVITLVAFVTSVAVVGPIGDGRGVVVALIVAAGLGLLLFGRVLSDHDRFRPPSIVVERDVD